MLNKLGAAALTVCPPGKIFSVFSSFPLGFTPLFQVLFDLCRRAPVVFHTNYLLNETAWCCVFQHPTNLL